ncbi:MAG: hemolysin family protein [Pseudomonadota bacterium]
MPANLVIEGIVILACVLASGIFSGSETALTSIWDARLQGLIDHRPLGVTYLERWQKHPNLVLSSILVGNNLVNILASSLATDLAIRSLQSSGVTDNTSAGIGLAVGIMTLLILVFGEVLPKTWARHNAEKVVSILPILMLFFYVSWPFSKLLSLTTRGLVQLSGGTLSPNGPTVTEEEIEFMIQKSTEEGSLGAEKEAMLSGVFDLHETMAKEIMVARTDLLGFEVAMNLDEVLKAIDERGFSRYPVFQENLDNIIGVFYARDLIPYLHLTDRQPFDLRDFVRPPYFVPMTKFLNQLLQEFRRDKVHIAVVVDEYGGTAGLVTLEDVIEEMVGEIYDEFDRAEHLFIRDADGSYRVRAKLSIDDLAEELDMDLPEDLDVDSVGGLLMVLAGQVPATGQELEWNVSLRDGPKRFLFKVLDANQVRVRMVRLRIEGTPVTPPSS